ncbi:MAG: flippase-like domain-containing protein [Myxococcota bacterium]|nr:flippase-like domain-containing protein [Myxococcota bacterium]
MTSARRVLVRTLLVVLGIGLIAFLVREAGPKRVATVLWSAAPWLPAILLLELVQLASDFFALRSILGRDWREVPTATWLRASALAYGMMVVLPAGRAAGEVTRATLFSKYLGAARAAAASTQLQASYVFANGFVSAVDCAVIAAWVASVGAGSSLPLLLAGNALLMCGSAAGLLAILWNGRLGVWLDRQRRRLSHLPSVPPPRSPQTGRPVPYVAAAICCASRGAQVLQYGVVLTAVGGVASVRGAFVAHGIHLVGSTLGDLIPNQLGVVDGAYRAFAAVVGFGDSPARALSIAFLARIEQLLIASACVVVAGLTRRAVSHDRPSPASADASAHS